jgi:hypothetical protein
VSESPPYPEEYVLKVVGEVEIRFAHPSESIDWLVPIFIHHFLSSSRVLLDREGRVTSEIINGPAAKSAICAVLSDEVLIAELISHAAEIEGALVSLRMEPLDTDPCESLAQPKPSPTPWPVATARPDINNWPEKYAIRVSEDVEIQFQIPDERTHHIASVVIRHFPSNSFLGVNEVGFATRDDIDGVEARTAICAVLNDADLMTRVTGRASALNAYTFGQTPRVNLPCESLDRPESSASVDPAVAEPLRVVYDRRDWPDDYRILVGDDVEIQFAYPLDRVGWTHPFVTWVSPIYIWHIPSSGAISVDIDGRVMLIERVVKPEAIAASCAVLSDAAVMAEVLSRALEIDVPRHDSRPVEPDPCTTPVQPEPSPIPPPEDYVRSNLETWPTEFTMPVNDEVEIRFAYPNSDGVHDSRIFITYLPSSASLHVDPEGRVASVGRTLSPNALIAVCAVFSDEVLMFAAQSRAAELNTYFIGHDPLVPNPCEGVE